MQADIISIGSQNCTSMAAHMQDIGNHMQDVNILALQEVRVPASRMKAMEKELRFEHGANVAFGEEPPKLTKQVPQARGMEAHRVTTDTVKQRGVAILSSLHMPPRTEAAPGELERKLRATSRWAEVFYPFSLGNTMAGLHVASVYAEAQADNETLFMDALTAAARLGNAPYAICMDANVDITASNVLSLAIESGRWHNAAEGAESEDARSCQLCAPLCWFAVIIC